MFNLVVLTGRLTADAELKYTTNNVPVTSFTIAVERKYKAGEERKTDFINIVAWRSTAEFVSKYFQKGSLIGIEGSIQTRKYTDDNDKTRTVFEVVANNAQFVESKRNNENVSENASDFTSSINENTDSAFSKNSPQEEFEEISGDGDLPF